jgi:hypothetical protein
MISFVFRDREEGRERVLKVFFCVWVHTIKINFLSRFEKFHASIELINDCFL